MHLALFVTADGIHHGGWRHPQASGADQGFGFYRRLAAQAEAAKLDMLFVADKLAVDDLYGNHFATTVRYRASRGTEPLTLLSALAVTTERIGLGGTISTSYTEPYHVARMFASIDHLSGGRVAWNAVTSVSDAEAHNFGRAEHYDHATRYDRAAEYLDVVRRLWDTWEEDAIAPDKAAGTYGDPAKVHYADHAGKWFDVKGPLSLPRPPQGHPVLIQAGASGAFQDLATRNAEIVFAVYPDINRAKDGYRRFKDDVAAAGRSPDAVKILPGMVPIIADSDDAAADLLGELDALVEPLAGLSFMSGSMNYDLADRRSTSPFPTSATLSGAARAASTMSSARRSRKAGRSPTSVAGTAPAFPSPRWSAARAPSPTRWNAGSSKKPATGSSPCLRSCRPASTGCCTTSCRCSSHAVSSATTTRRRRCAAISDSIAPPTALTCEETVHDRIRPRRAWRVAIRA
jgi:FMN-dependent oxidoreductase (nitrilotriacetate monooxygenase family)